MPELDYAHELERLIDLWDKHSTREWRVGSERHGVNVTMINAYVAHSVNLSRAVLALHRAGFQFELVSLVRSTMEAAVTASWLAVTPEKTLDFTRHSAGERKRLLQEIVDKGLSDGGEGLPQVNELLAQYVDPIDKEGKWLANRFRALNGGDHLYTIYRVLCAWDHATNGLADQYTLKSEESEENPYGIVMLNRAQDSTDWVGMQAAMVLRAQIAADMILVKRRHKTQLSNFARRFGVSDSIMRVIEDESGGPAEQPET